MYSVPFARTHRRESPARGARRVGRFILYKFKTGCQWWFLPVKQFFSALVLRWLMVYYHFNQWRKDGVWTELWVSVLRPYKS